MDLVSGAKKKIIMMQHTAKGKPKVLKKCEYEVTGVNVVDVLITDKGLFKWQEGTN